MTEDKREVVVTDIKIPFWSMVVLMVKWAIAAIPAVIILMLIAALISFALSMLAGTGWHHHYWGMSRGWS
ncbi:MAG: hypothetical protein MUP61_03355 [Burkholderiales bacterium]|nr:hypothetical protein [Burkholderiales bacterium]MCJ7838240.1 hypothetical protein [Burkholderiales bacterium]